MTIFVDTSASIALNDRSDAFHAKARRFYEALTAADRLFTSNYVIDETITRLRYAVGHAAALAFAEAMLKGRLFSIFYVDSDLEQAGVAVLRKYRDKKLSFTDCLTIAIVVENKLDSIFAFDDDFAKVGLRSAP